MLLHLPFKSVTVAALFAASLCSARAEPSNKATSSDFALADEQCRKWGSKLVDIAKTAKSISERDDQIKTAKERLEVGLASVPHLDDLGMEKRIRDCLVTKGKDAFGSSTAVTVVVVKRGPSPPSAGYEVNVRPGSSIKK
jgi:hypothetical protein